MIAFGELIRGFSAHYAYEERNQSHEVGATQSSLVDSTPGNTVLGRGKKEQVRSSQKVSSVRNIRHIF